MDLALQEVECCGVVDHDIGEQPDEHKIDLRQGDKQPDHALGYGVKGEDLDNAPACHLAVRDKPCFVVLYGIGDPRHDAVAGERGDSCRDKRVYCNAPPDVPVVELDAKERGALAWSEVEEGRIVAGHDVDKHGARQETPAEYQQREDTFVVKHSFQAN